jgi:hypothetical protein
LKESTRNTPAGVAQPPDAYPRRHFSPSPRSHERGVPHHPGGVLSRFPTSDEALASTRARIVVGIEAR